MPLNLISNYAANVANRILANSANQATESLYKLSSGTRVLTARDDAASLAVGSRLAADVAALKQVAVNAGQAVSLLQIADGAMGKVNDVLVRMKALAVQSGSGQLSGTERAMLDTEYQALLSEIDRIASDTDFAGTQLVNGAKTVTQVAGYSTTDGVANITLRGDHAGSNGTIQYDGAGGFSLTTSEGQFTGTIASDANDGTDLTTGTVVTLTLGGSTNKIDIALSTAFDYDAAIAASSMNFAGTTITTFTFKVGTGTVPTSDDISVSIHGVGTTTLSIGTTDVSSQSSADSASAAVSNAIEDLQSYRTQVSAAQSRIGFAVINVATQLENSEAARSELLDLNVADEMSTFVSQQILVQAGASMVAQANQLPQNLLRLFQ